MAVMSYSQDMSQARATTHWLLLPLLALACSQAAYRAKKESGVSRHEAVNLAAVQELLWSGQADIALALLETQRWEFTGSVAAERRWQDLRREQGQDALVVAEMQRLRQAYPGLDPDLDYLEARLLEDGSSRAKAMARGHRRWPRHPWFRLGAAATSQQGGDWARARQLLAEAHETAATASFLHLLQARQAGHEGKEQAAFAAIEQDAFVSGEELALWTYLDLAEQFGSEARRRRAQAELALLAAEQAEPLDAVRIDLAMDRFLAERPWMHAWSFSRQLQQLDRYCRRAGAPAGWSEAPRYRLGSFATLIQPEPESSELASRWLQAGRFLLAGDAWGRDPEFHLLTDVSSHAIPWPGEERPLTLILGRGVAAPGTPLAQGGTVFHGFYLRLDRLRQGIEALERRLGTVKKRTDAVASTAPIAPNRHADPRDLESVGLPDRLRRQLLALGSQGVAELEFRHLLLHEAGHLNEILPWLGNGLPLRQVLPAMLRSQSQFGAPLLWLEYRAELRALAASEHPQWLLAEIIERAQEPRDPYHKPYRHLLEQLLRQAQEEGLPALADWDRLSTESMTALATAVLNQEELAPIPPPAKAALWQAFDEEQLGVVLPSDWQFADGLDHH